MVAEQHLVDRVEAVAGRRSELKSDATAARRERWQEETSQHLMEMLKQQIRPEFLNRIDETVVFTPLNKSEIRRIVRMQADAVSRMLSDSGISLSVDESAVSLIADAGFDSEFGARPVKRAMQTLLLNRLSTMILSGAVDRTRPLTASAGPNGEITFVQS